jgi:hypothetical protein
MNTKEHTMVCGVEEANEVATASLAVAKALSKMLRFGQENIVPFNNLNIREHLANELNDLEACVEMLIEAGVELPGLHDRQAIQSKKLKVKHYMQFAKNQGVLTD